MTHSRPARGERAALGFALATVCIDAMGIGLIFPVMPALLQSLGLDSVSDAALWGGVLGMLYAAMQFLCAPLLGALSDRFGRRVVLLVGLAALTVDYVILSLAGGLVVLLAGRAIAGAAGATYATASAVIADITPESGRAARFGLIGAMFGIGFVLGPALGGLVASWHIRAPFMLAAVLAGTNLLFGALAFPETLPQHRRRPIDWRVTNPFRALAAAFTLPGIAPLLIVVALFHLGNHIYPTLWAYWSTARFGWSPGLIGASLAAYGILLALVQGVLVGPAVSRFGEWRIALWGCVAGSLAALGFALVAAPWLVFVLICLAALSDLAPPALTATLSGRVGADAQGELQGILSAITALTAVLTPPIATGAFYLATRPGGGLDMPGAPFLITAGLLALATGLLLRIDPAQR